MISLQFRVRDRVFVWLSVLVISMTVGLVWWAYPELPARIPSHFGPLGRPDAWADKSFWLVAFTPLLQIIMSAVFIWVYRHPHYANILGRIQIAKMPEPIRGMLYTLIRHLVVVMSVLSNLIFAHINLATISVAFQLSSGINNWLLGGLVFIMFSFLAFYTFWVYRLVQVGKSMLQENQITPTNHV